MQQQFNGYIAEIHMKQVEGVNTLEQRAVSRDAGV
jgi:hypothetical protein